MEGSVKTPLGQERWELGLASQMEKAFAQGEVGRELLPPAIRGSVWLGFGDGRVREHCIPGIFAAAGRHVRDLPTPEIQRYGPLLSWIHSRDIFLLPARGGWKYC